MSKPGRIDRKKGASRAKVAKVAKTRVKASKSSRRQVTLELRPLGRVAGLLAVIALVGLGIDWSVTQLDRPIRQVNVNGELHYIDALQIERTASAQIAEGVLTTDLRSVQQLLHESPWVERAAVRRQWPGVLNIWLEERVPVARWGENSLLTETGSIFTPQQDIGWIALPRLDGPAAHEAEVLEQYLWFSRNLQEIELEVVAVTLEPRGVWRIELRQGQGIQLYLGQQDLAQKLARFKAIYQLTLQQRMEQIARIDLRYSNGIAVLWKKGTQTHEQV
jgi:cell division protein FtsQ